VLLLVFQIRVYSKHLGLSLMLVSKVRVWE